MSKSHRTDNPACRSHAVYKRRSMPDQICLLHLTSWQPHPQLTEQTPQLSQGDSYNSRVIAQPSNIPSYYSGMTNPYWYMEDGQSGLAGGHDQCSLYQPENTGSLSTIEGSPSRASYNCWPYSCGFAPPNSLHFNSLMPNVEDDVRSQQQNVISPHAFSEQSEMPNAQIQNDKEDSPATSSSTSSRRLRAAPKSSKHADPYKSQLERCLRSKNNEATLKEIYEWFELHTDRATADTKGWQNSIRHNLSMNEVRLREGLEDPTY